MRSHVSAVESPATGEGSLCAGSGSGNPVLRTFLDGNASLVVAYVESAARSVGRLTRDRERLDGISRRVIVVSKELNPKCTCVCSAKCANRNFDAGHRSIGCRREGNGDPGLKWKVWRARSDGIAKAAEKHAVLIGAEVARDRL